ncbi:hypothetical protein QTP88_004568 [Uroleucon formosanum]
MKVKRKMEAGCGFKQMVMAAKNSIKNKMKEKNITKLIRNCLTTAKKSKTKKTKTPRIIPIPKKGGVLPLIPIFVGLSALDVSGGYVYDCRITQIGYYSFLPYSTSALSNNDEVRIALHNTESYTLPCESYIYIEGTVTKPDDLIDDIRFMNNGLTFLFSEMKYELNGIQIQKLVNTGITSTLKGNCSYNKSDIVSHYNAAWDDDVKNVNKDFIEGGVFNGCINFKDLFGFCEDYKRILINCNQQLILNRASLDINATDRKNSMNKAMSCFDHCKIKNLKVYLNSEVFPYEDFQSDFTKNKMATLYHAYAEFQKSYYGRDNVTPLLTRSDFKKLSPIIVIDMSRQNDNVKTSTVDLRIEMETEEAFSASTSTYCLILHDQIITYNPFNGEVRTL